MTAALPGYVVLDRADCVAGEYCARLLSDFGATVWHSQPTGGSATARIPPFDGDGRSLTHLHLNIGKRQGPPDTAPDVVICAPDDDLTRARADHPGAVLVQITGFGTDGPMAGWLGPEIVLQAASGMMNSNGIRGREPLYGVGNRASYAAGLAAYIQVLVSLRVRARTGQGDVVRIDAAETASTMCFPYMLQTAYNGADRRRGDQDIPAGQVLCRGAWVCLWVYSNRFARLCQALGLDHCLSDIRFADPSDRSNHWGAFFDLVQKRVGDRDPDEFVAALQGMDIISARAFRPSELRQSRHLHARGYWREVVIDGRAHVIPGPVFRMGATPARDHSGDKHASA